MRFCLYLYFSTNYVRNCSQPCISNHGVDLTRERCFVISHKSQTRKVGGEKRTVNLLINENLVLRRFALVHSLFSRSGLI